MERKSTKLRKLLETGRFLHMPSVYDPLGARLTQEAGFETAFVGGYVTGAALAESEPLMTMTEQLEVAEAVSNACSLPIVVDVGAGYGDALHVMRTVRECVRAGLAGMQIEDQLFPKRAHYHKYVAHVISMEEYIEKIAYAARQRDEIDPDFVIVARTDTAREIGFEEAVKRTNAAADVGADLGLIFPRNADEAERAPKMTRLPLVYVMSRGNREGRPIFTRQELAQMGYVACFEASLSVCVVHHFLKAALTELHDAGTYTAMSEAQMLVSRKAIEDVIGLDAYYAIEDETVEQRHRRTAEV